MSKLYNEEQKERYLYNYVAPVNQTNTKNIFINLTETEEANHKDVSCFSSYEIIDYYKCLNATSVHSLFVINSVLSQYTQWCLQENLVPDSQNHFLEFDFATLNQYVNKLKLDNKIITREELLSWLQFLPNPRDQFAILALFEFGKSKLNVELTHAHITDIQDNSIKLCTGREPVISDELKNYALNSANTYEYVAMTGDEERINNLVGDNIIKNYPNTVSTSDKSAHKRLYTSILRVMQRKGLDLTINDIVESGKIHMIKTRAAELGISSKEYVNSPYIKEVETQFNCRIEQKRYIIKYGDYL